MPDKITFYAIIGGDRTIEVEAYGFDEGEVARLKRTAGGDQIRPRGGSVRLGGVFPGPRSYRAQRPSLSPPFPAASAPSPWAPAAPPPRR